MSSGRKKVKSVMMILKNHNNITFQGKLVLTNNQSASLTSRIANQSLTSVSSREKVYDETGASFYVIAVILVYGMSIVMLIASHIKRRQDKVAEDKQIHKYLQDFQIVKERHARESYKNMKRAIIKKINWEKQNKATYSNLQQSMMPLLAIGMPTAKRMTDLDAHSLSSSLSNVDLAAAEQYMKAKDKGKVYQSRKTSNAIAAKYFAAARKLSREQSPNNITLMFKERKISVERSPFLIPPPVGVPAPVPSGRSTLQPLTFSKIKRLRTNSESECGSIPEVHLEEVDSNSCMQPNKAVEQKITIIPDRQVHFSDGLSTSTGNRGYHKQRKSTIPELQYQARAKSPQNLQVPTIGFHSIDREDSSPLLDTEIMEERPEQPKKRRSPIQSLCSSLHSSPGDSPKGSPRSSLHISLGASPRGSLVLHASPPVTPRGSPAGSPRFLPFGSANTDDDVREELLQITSV